MADVSEPADSALDLEITRIGLPTGVTLTVQLGGDRSAEPIMLLHGFPESHRTWRFVAPDLARRLTRQRVSQVPRGRTAAPRLLAVSPHSRFAYFFPPCFWSPSLFVCLQVLHRVGGW